MEKEVVGLKLHVMKEIGILSFIENIFDWALSIIYLASIFVFRFLNVEEGRSVLVPNAMEFNEISDYHENNTGKHLRCKDESLNDHPDLNISASVNGFVHVPNHVWNIQDWNEGTWVDYEL